LCAPNADCESTAGACPLLSKDRDDFDHYHRIIDEIAGLAINRFAAGTMASTMGPMEAGKFSCFSTTAQAADTAPHLS
jgi:hypothetical protein